MRDFPSPEKRAVWERLLGQIVHLSSTNAILPPRFHEASTDLLLGLRLLAMLAHASIEAGMEELHDHLQWFFASGHPQGFSLSAFHVVRYAFLFLHSSLPAAASGARGLRDTCVLSEEDRFPVERIKLAVAGVLQVVLGRVAPR